MTLVETSKCCNCNYEWPTGQDGTHSCPAFLQQTIQEQAQRIEEQQEMIKSQGTRIEQSVMQARARIKEIQALQGKLDQIGFHLGRAGEVLNTQDT
jgi:hypothetical protein